MPGDDLGAATKESPTAIALMALQAPGNAGWRGFIRTSHIGSLQTQRAAQTR